MSATCSLTSEYEYTSNISDYECSCPAPASLLPLRLRDPNAFPFTTQPIVYYADISDLYSKKQKGQEKKDKPNHFAKAFHWYAREHALNEKTEAETQGIGFASWLDHKYQQYLRDTTKSASFKSEASNVPIPTSNQDVVMQKTTKPKGLKRILRSPWRKRHAAAKSPEGENSCIECKSSWETILRPKSLSRLESENCAKKRSTTCGSSKVTVTSSDTQVTIRSKKLFVQETTVRCDYSHILNQNVNAKPSTENPDEKKIRRKSKTQVKCECPKMDMTTQYDPIINIKDKPVISQVTPTSIPTINTYSGSSKEKNSKFKKKKSISKVQNITCQCPKDPNEWSKNYKMDPRVQHDQNKINEDTKPLLYIPTGQISPPCFTNKSNKSTGLTSERPENHQKSYDCVCPRRRSANGAAQTSDCAIIPENFTNGHPVLLRIV